MAAAISTSSVVQMLSTNQFEVCHNRLINSRPRQRFFRTRLPGRPNKSSRITSRLIGVQPVQATVTEDSKTLPDLPIHGNIGRSILVIDNYDSFTYNLCQYLGDLGARFDVYRNDELTLEEVKEEEELERNKLGIMQYLANEANSSRKLLYFRTKYTKLGSHLYKYVEFKRWKISMQIRLLRVNLIRQYQLLCDQLCADLIILKWPLTYIYYHFDRKNPKGILISPGPGTPQDSGISLQIVLELGPTVPLFGVCMGLQCIGEAFGGNIVRSPYGVMHGKKSLINYDEKGEDGILAGLSNPFTAARYHSLVIDKESFPHNELEITAWTNDGLIMGVRHKRYKHIQAVQFHPESIITYEGKKIVQNFINMIERTEGLQPF